MCYTKCNILLLEKCLIKLLLFNHIVSFEWKKGLKLMSLIFEKDSVLVFDGTNLMYRNFYSHEDLKTSDGFQQAQYMELLKHWCLLPKSKSYSDVCLLRQKQKYV